MGFVVWAALTGMVLWAALRLVIRLTPRLPIAEQIVAACVTAIALVLIPIQALGYASLLYGWALAAGVLAEVGLAVILTRPLPLGPWFAGLKTTARRTLSRPVTALVTGIAACGVLLLGACVALFPSWSWDAMWYHDPITAYAFQEHSLHWVDTWIPFVNSYPKAIELLALWNGIFTPDDTLIDAVQLPLLVMGILALAAILRRAGAEGGLAWGMALVFLLFPAVFLNTPSDYVDVAAACLWLAAVLFLCRFDSGPAEWGWGALALGLYLGSKVTGALHAALLAPIVLVALVRVGRRLGWRTAFGAGAAMAVLIVGLGGASYIRDMVKFGNPVWPAQVVLPVIHKALPGDWAVTSFTTPPFGGPDDLHALWRSFIDEHPMYYVDVRVAGFGWLWVYLLIPLIGVAFALGVADLARRRWRDASGLLVLALLLVASLVTPAKWWPRYVLGFPAAGLLAAGMVLRRIPRPMVQQAGLMVIASWALWQAYPARNGIFGRKDPGQLFAALQMDGEARATQRFDTWQQPNIALRDQLVQPGEASIYDKSTSFVYQLWRRDWKNRVLYRPFSAPADQWLAELDRERVRWASLERNSIGDRVLREHGWQALWPCESEICTVLVRPGPIPGAPGDQAR